MIPRHPNWYSLKGAVGEYVKSTLTYPIINHSLFSLSLGPERLSESNGKLDSRYWVAFEDDNGIYISGANEGSWSESVFLFEVALKPSEIQLTFDQLGRPIVLFVIGDDINLYWYDPVSEGPEVKYLCKGSFVQAGFDYFYNTSDPDSDAMCFYVRGNSFYMRLQRERWDIEHEETIVDENLLPVNQLELLSNGLRDDNKYQVVYRYIDENYKPPTPQPPTQPVQTGSWSYFLNGYQSVIDFRADMLQLNTEFSIGIQLDSVELDKPDIALWSHQQAQVEGYYGGMMAVSFTGQSHNVVRVLYGGRVFESLAPFQLQPGHWLSEVTIELTGTYLTVSVKPSGQSGYISHRVKVSPNYESSEYSSLKIGAMSGTRGRMMNCLRGSISAVTVVTPTYASGLKLAMDHNSYPETGLPGELQPILNTDGSPSGMDNAIIRDYRPQNWAFNPD